MGDGREIASFRKVEGASGGSGYANVAPDLSKEVYRRVDGEGEPRPWRAGYGQVAPSFNGTAGTGGDSGSQGVNGGDNGSTSSSPGRAGYGQVAPGFPAPGQDNGGGHVGNTDGTQIPPGRSPYGEVAPPAGGQGGGDGGTRTPYGEVVPPWRPKVEVPTSPPSRGTDGGNRGLQQVVEQKRGLVERSLEKNTSFWGNEIIGGASGAFWGGPGAYGLSYGAKLYLAKSEGVLSWLKSTREAGAPVEGRADQWKFRLATAAEKPLEAGQKAAKWYENTHGVATSNGPIASLRRQEAKIIEKLEGIAKTLEPEVKKIQLRTEKQLSAGGQPALTADEQSLLDLHKYLKEGANGPIPPAAAKFLNGEDLATLARYQATASEVTQIARAAGIAPADFLKYVQAMEVEAESASAVEVIAKRIQPQVDQINPKVLAGQALNDAEKAVMEAHDFVKGAGQAPPTGVLSAEETVAVINHRQNVQALKDLAAQEGFNKIPADRLKALLPESAKAATDMEAILGRLGPRANDLTQKIGLTPEEVTLLHKYNFLKGTGQKPADGVLTADEEALVAQRELIRGRVAQLESELKATPHGVKGFMQNFAKGMLTVGVVQGIDDRLDRAFFGKQHNSASTVIDSIVLPGAMLLPGGWLKKGLAAVVGHVAGKYLVGDWLDKHLGVSDSPGWGRFLRPNGVEAFAVAGAALLPMREEKALMRLGYMGLAWLGSHSLNYVLDGASPREKRDEAFDAFKADKSKRSCESMNTAIDQFKDLGKQNEAALNFYLADWLARKHDDLLNGYRGAAILLAAAGETRLGEGTLVSPGQGKPTSNPIVRALSFKNNSHEYNNILAGYDLDLGGRSLKSLVSARIEIERAKSYTQTLIDQGADVRDKKVSADEIDGLDKTEQRVEATLEKIYGKHDIAGIAKELEEWLNGLNQQDGAKILRSIKGTIAKPGVNDPRYVAKFYRDQALLELAWAGVKIGHNGVGSGADGESAQIMYAEAIEALKQARALDANNPDLEQLETLAQEIGKAVPQKRDAQWESPSYNPLGVDNQSGK